MAHAPGFAGGCRELAELASIVRVLARAGLLAGLAAIGAGAVLCAGASATAPPPTTTPPSTLAPTPTTAAPTTVVAPTSTVVTTTTTLPPVDLLARVPWIQRTFASPCSETAVQMIAGSAIDGASLAVIDDVLPIDPFAGVALAFLSCHSADSTTTETTALVVRVSPRGTVASVAEQELGPQARVVAVDLPSFTVETPDGTPIAGSCCAPFVRRRSYTVGPEGFEVGVERQVAAFLQTIASPVVGGDGDLVRASVPAAALCYRWDDVYLTLQDPADAPTTVNEPSAELQTLRLALIHLTGRWITPSSYMTEEMSGVVTEYQESRGLTVDGQIGAETTSAMHADLGCSGGGSFNQVVPTGLGPRRFGSIDDLLAATQRFATAGSTGNASFDGLLRAAQWDGLNSMFLGCYRWETPPSGMSCSWSGRTPMQLIGLVDDPASPGISTFSILYARSAPPA